MIPVDGHERQGGFLWWEVTAHRDERLQLTASREIVRFLKAPSARSRQLNAKPLGRSSSARELAIESLSDL